jgi:bacillithiol system protein YtxJ
MTKSEPIPLTEDAHLDAACGRELAVIYKHSPRCGVSLTAADEVRRFAEAEPAVPVYVLDVVRDRVLAREVERRLGVRHESPQTLLLRAGEVVWDASHRGVTARALAAALEQARPESPGGQ